jgi:uncharacterized protein YndB with AHSA1/START domain
MPANPTKNSATLQITTPSDREIRITRLFDAPRHLVFEAMSKPEHIERWWGAVREGQSRTECEVDLRPGGRWRFVIRMADGQEVAFHGVYREITPPERMVYTEVFEQPGVPDVSDDDSVVTAVFTEESGQTRLTLTSAYPSVEVRDIVLKSGMEEGVGVGYERLEEVAIELRARR